VVLVLVERHISVTVEISWDPSVRALGQTYAAIRATGSCSQNQCVTIPTDLGSEEMDDTPYDLSWKLEIEAAMEHNNGPQPSHMLMIALNVTIDDPAFILLYIRVMWHPSQFMMVVKWRHWLRADPNTNPNDASACMC
jgi:hypothetical protein